MPGLVLGHKKSRITARNMATALEADYNERFIDEHAGYSYVFRYGNSSVPLPTAGDCTAHVFNNAKAIQLSSNKSMARKHMLENGVACPEMWADYNEAINTSPDRFIEALPMIARPHYHFQGRQFHVVKTVSSAYALLQSGYYLQRIVEKKEEYRVFMFLGKFFEINRKVPTNAVKSDMVRNYGNGWFFEWLTYTDVDRLLLDQCKRAQRAITLDWCAIDCAIDVQGNAWVFEVNSAPALISRKCEKLAAKIREWMLSYRASGGSTEY